jgi:uncharacterized protein (UPF0261 family)
MQVVRGIPQIVAPACYDLVDLIGWQPVPPRLQGRPTHDHNRLLTSTMLTAAGAARDRRALCAESWRTATGPSAFILPRGGCNEWDSPEGPLHDARRLTGVLRSDGGRRSPRRQRCMRWTATSTMRALLIQVLEIFDDWVARGLIKT